MELQRTMVTKSIQEKTKSKVIVSLDNGLSFALYKGELRTFNIREDREITEENYLKIMTEVLPHRAKMRAMNLLKVRPYSEKGLYDKLKENDYPEEVIQIAMDYVKSYHYIDDMQYALDYIYTYKDRKNKTRLKCELLKKGIISDIIENALAEELSDSSEEYEKEQIIKILEKKHFNSETFSYEDKMKLLSSLYRKGYSVELSKKLLDIT